MLDTAHRYFLEVVRTGSVKDAAANLHVAASAVSRQIAKLEDASGQALFDRRPHGMTPTRAGELLARYVRRTAMDTQRVRMELRSLEGGGARSTIRVGSNEAVALSILPNALAEFRESHPDVAFQVQIASPAGVAQGLADGGIDIGVAFSVRAGLEVAVRYEVSSPLRAMMAPGHPLAGRARVSLNDLKPYPLALTDSGTTVRLLFDAYSNTGEGPPFNIAYSSSSSSLIYAVVKATDAVTLAGEITQHDALEHGDLAAVAISDAGFGARTLQVQTAKDRPLSTEAEQFLSVLTRAMQGKAR